MRWWREKQEVTVSLTNFYGVQSGIKMDAWWIYWSAAQQNVEKGDKVSTSGGHSAYFDSFLEDSWLQKNKLGR